MGYSMPNKEAGICRKCNGTGKFMGNGYDGECYSCRGKGHQTIQDIKRDRGYNFFQTKRMREAAQEREANAA